jgi:ATP-dependent protease HslVU (ClpYQ) peptidase subunit
MTCIAGVVHNGEVWIGGDSAGSTLQFINSRLDPKVFRNGPYLIGFTTTFRMGQILRYSFKPPKYKTGRDLFEFMVTDFINAFRSSLRNAGHMGAEGSKESGGNFLVGTQGRLFNIDSDFQVGECTDSYDSVGSGSFVAMGALYANKDKDPRFRIQQALEAAERYNPYVRAPFTIEKL